MKKTAIAALTLTLSLLCGSTVFATEEYPEEGYGMNDGILQETPDNSGNRAQDVIANYLMYDNKLTLTLDEVKSKNAASYTAGKQSVYGKALTQKELDEVAQKVHEVVTSYITESMNDVQKVDMLYSYLLHTCSYAPTWEENRANTAWGALIYGEAQCSGYARAFKALCDAVDIPCYYVHANEASMNPSHQWNIVQVDGKWYHIDVQGCVFLVSDTLFAGTGMEWNRSEFPQCPESFFSYEDEWGFFMPYTPPANWLASREQQ